MNDIKSFDIQNEKRENRFNKNPKMIIFFAIIIGILMLIFIAEKILEHKEKGTKSAGVQRHIRLRERPPLLSMISKPSDDFMLTVDSLIQKPYQLRTDNNGFILPNRKYEKADKIIVFIGGSTTESMYVEEKSRFPYLSGLLIEKKSGLHITSYNSGVAGNNSLHSIDILINKIIPLKPDIVIMMHNANDLTMLLYLKSYWNNHWSRSPIITDDKSASYKFLVAVKDLFIPNLWSSFRSATNYLNAIKGLLDHPKGKSDEFSDLRGKKIVIDEEKKRKIIKEFAMNLQTFISICKIRGIIPVLMTQENRLTDIPDPLIKRVLADRLKNNFEIEYKDYKELFDSMNQTVRDVAITNNVLIIDLDHEIPHTKAFMYDFVHFNDKGSIKAAEVISNKILHLVQ